MWAGQFQVSFAKAPAPAPAAGLACPIAWTGSPTRPHTLRHSPCEPPARNSSTQWAGPRMPAAPWSLLHSARTPALGQRPPVEAAGGGWSAARPPKPWPAPVRLAAFRHRLPLSPARWMPRQCVITMVPTNTEWRTHSGWRPKRTQWPGSVGCVTFPASGCAWRGAP